MIKKHKIRKRIIVILLFVLFAAAVSFFGFQQLTRNAMMEDLLGNDPFCSLPCWNNISPGITKSAESVEILRRTAYIAKDSIQQSGNENSGGCRWKWIVSGSRILPKLSWQNGIVRDISLGLSFTLTVGEVLKQFGTPEAVVIMEGGTPENWYWIVDIFFPRYGIQAKAYTPTFSSLIESSTEIGAIVLFSPISIENRISELYPDTNAGQFNRLYKVWKGFGDLKKLYKILD